MDLDNLVENVVQAICNLDCNILDQIDEASYYSYQDKQQLIQHFNWLFVKIKSKGIDSLTVKDSQCKYCYPHGNAYSFHHPETGEFVIRYVIAKDGQTEEGEQCYAVDECKNKPIPDDFWEKMEKNS